MFSLSHVRCDAPNAQSILVRADSNTHDFLIYSGQSLNRVVRSTYFLAGFVLMNVHRSTNYIYYVVFWGELQAKCNRPELTKVQSANHIRV